MNWRLADLPIEARLAAERAAEAQGRTLDAWLVAAVCASLEYREARPVYPSRLTSRPPESRDQATSGEPAPKAAEIPAPAQPALPTGPIALLPLAALKPPRDRLRRGGDATALAALSVEIGVGGVREPVLVRREKGAEAYEIVAGERRRLAAEQAGKEEIPAIVIEADDGAALLLSLAENLAHRDFTPLDEARAYLRLLTEHRINPGVLTERLGIGRLRIASSLRLLGLPQRARDAIESGRIGADQAYRLLDSADPDAAIDRLTSNDKA